MGIPTRQANLTPQQWAFYGVTVGTVCDTNDPQQMGRVRAVCLALNDSLQAKATDIPWASYVTPFGGTIQAGTIGKDDSPVSGPHAYGMWAIPKIGSQVLVMCLDGNPQIRVWMGCLHTPLATHTMPHGRYSYKDDKKLPDEEKQKPVGPFSTFETTIEPLHTNLRTAFDSSTNDDFTGEENFEFQSRGADFQVSGLGLGQVGSTTSSVEDDQDETAPAISVEGTNSNGTDFAGSRQGYQTSRIAPDQVTELTPRNLDNTVTSIVSPGFHAFSMDDRQENCRVRVRTTGGHQIIMDDSNERIYISTASGKNWIEMDEQGNIDIYTSGKISAHAEDDINFTSDRSIRFYGKAGIQLKSDQEVRITAENDISLKTNAVFRAKAANNVLIEASKDVHIKSSGDMFQTAGATIHTKGKTLAFDSSSNSSFTVGGYFTASATGNANIKGSKVNLNSGDNPTETTNSADQADSDDVFNAFFPNRIPDHEPWARVDTLANNTVKPQHAYDGLKVGKQRRLTATDGISDETSDELITITRGANWRR